MLSMQKHVNILQLTSLLHLLNLMAHLRQVLTRQLPQVHTLQKEKLHARLELTALQHDLVKDTLQLSSHTTAMTSMIWQDTSADCSLLIEGHQHAQYELSQSSMCSVSNET
jgi:hypothetical protein